jgi:hypothetical protein
MVGGVGRPRHGGVLDESGLEITSFLGQRRNSLVTAMKLDRNTANTNPSKIDGCAGNAVKEAGLIAHWTVSRRFWIMKNNYTSMMVGGAVIEVVNYLLPPSFILCVTENVLPVSKGTVQFIGSGDLITASGLLTLVGSGGDLTTGSRK